MTSRPNNTFVPLRELTARAVMRSMLKNFLAEMADVLALRPDEALNLALLALNEARQDDDAADVERGS